MKNATTVADKSALCATTTQADIKPKQLVDHPDFYSDHNDITHADFHYQTIPPSKVKPSLNTQEKVGFNSIGLDPVSEQPKRLRMVKRCEVVTAQFYDHSTREVFKPIWDAIRRVIVDAVQRMARPIAVIVRFTLFTNTDSPSKVIQRVVERLKRAGSLCKYVWVREVRSEDYEGNTGDYEHYHAALLFDRKFAFVGTIKKAFDTLKSQHWIESYHLSSTSTWHAVQKKHRLGIKVHDILKPDGVAAFEKHAAYLAKTETKQHCERKRLFGSSKISEAI